MKREEIRAVVLGSLGQVAPELNLETIDPHASIRDQYDLDSVDYLNFIVAIHTKTGIDIPEVDYPKLVTLDDCVEYVTRALGE